MKNDNMIIMKTFIAATFAALVFFAFEMTVPQTSEAGVTCRTDYLGNYVCRSSGGLSSTTRRDYLGNDVTTFNNGSRMSCRTDFFGNYVCN